MTDFTNCPIVPGRAYNGANGSKIAVEYGGGIYMLKFPPSGERKPTNLEPFLLKAKQKLSVPARTLQQAASACSTSALSKTQFSTLIATAAARNWKM